MRVNIENINFNDRRQNVHYLALLVLFFTAAILLIAAPKWTVDDAFITFRYVDNFVSNGDFTWNVGEDRVQGYTGIAWPLVLSGVRAAGVPVVAASQILGSIAFLCSGVLLLVISRGLRIRGRFQLAIIALYLLSPIGITNSLAGLETVFFSATLLLTLTLLQRGIRLQTVKSELVMVIAALLPPLVRPEGAVMTLLAILAYAVFLLSVQPSRLVRFVIYAGILSATALIIYVAVSLTYYDSILPNTFYAKSVGGYYVAETGTLFLDKETLLSFGVFLTGYLAIPVLIGLTGYVGMSVKSRDAEQISTTFSASTDRGLSSRSLPILGVSLLLTAIILGFYSTIVRTEMNFALRFFFPFFPLSPSSRSVLQKSVGRA